MVITQKTSQAKQNRRIRHKQSECVYPEARATDLVISFIHFDGAGIVLPSDLHCDVFTLPIIILWVFMSSFLIKLTVICSNYGSMFSTVGACGDFSHRYHLPAPMVRNILYCNM